MDTRSSTNDSDNDSEIEILPMPSSSVGSDRRTQPAEEDDRSNGADGGENTPLLAGSSSDVTEAPRRKRYGLFCFSPGKTQHWQAVLKKSFLLGGSAISLGIGIRFITTHTKADIERELLGAYPCEIGCKPYEDIACDPRQQLYQWPVKEFRLFCFADPAAQNITKILRYLLAIPNRLQHSRFQDLGVPMMAPGQINSTDAVNYMLQQCAFTNVSLTPCPEPLAPLLNVTRATYEAAGHQILSKGAAAFMQLDPAPAFDFFGQGSVCFYSLFNSMCLQDDATNARMDHLYLSEIFIKLLLALMIFAGLSTLLAIMIRDCFHRRSIFKSCFRSCVSLFKAPEPLMEADDDEPGAAPGIMPTG